MEMAYFIINAVFADEVFTPESGDQSPNLVIQQSLDQMIRYVLEAEFFTQEILL